MFMMSLGAIHKRRPQSVGFVQCGHFADKWDKGFFRCRCPNFLVQKTSDFSKFLVCQHRQGGLSKCGHFSDKEGGKVNFVTSFMEGPLLKIVSIKS